MQAAVPIACFLSIIRPPGVQYESSLLQIAPVDKSKCPFMKDGNDVAFQLFTRHNPTVYQELMVNDDEKLFASNMDFHDRTVIYFHAFMEQPEDGSGVMVREAYMQRGDTNVIMVDAHHLEAGPWYLTAAQNTWFIGRFAAQFIDYLASRGLNLNNTHLVGHSLGAHSAGVAGTALKSGRVARITGLDPALPLFSHLPLEQRLDPSDAQFVDVIHTDVGIFGYKQPLGHVDFFPNGGKSPQPGCELEVVIPQQLLLNKFFCSHWRSYQFYTESVLRPASFVATSCPSWNKYKSGGCAYQQHTHMGYGVDTKHMRLNNFTSQGRQRIGDAPSVAMSIGLGYHLPPGDPHEQTRGFFTYHLKALDTMANIEDITPEKLLKLNQMAKEENIKNSSKEEKANKLLDRIDHDSYSMNRNDSQNDTKDTQTFDPENKLQKENSNNYKISKLVDSKYEPEHSKHKEQKPNATTRKDFKELLKLLLINIGPVIGNPEQETVDSEPKSLILDDLKAITQDSPVVIIKQVIGENKPQTEPVRTVVQNPEHRIHKRQKRFIQLFRRDNNNDEDNFLFKMLDFLLKNRKNVLPVFTVMREINTLVKSGNGELNQVSKERNNYIGGTAPLLPPINYSLELGSESRAVSFLKRLFGLAPKGGRLTVNSS